VGTGYFEQLNTVIAGGVSSLAALASSTKEEQFQTEPAPISERRISAGG